jgi:hypothetical protein
VSLLSYPGTRINSTRSTPAACDCDPRLSGAIQRSSHQGRDVGRRAVLSLYCGYERVRLELCINVMLIAIAGIRVLFAIAYTPGLFSVGYVSTRHTVPILMLLF